MIIDENIPNPTFGALRTSWVERHKLRARSVCRFWELKFLWVLRIGSRDFFLFTWSGYFGLPELVLVMNIFERVKFVSRPKEPYTVWEENANLHGNAKKLLWVNL
jgi:hypothetical protein